LFAQSFRVWVAAFHLIEFPRATVIWEMMWWEPSTPATASSIFLVIYDSSSAGAAPNCVIKTEMSGTSTLGMRVIAEVPECDDCRGHDDRWEWLPDRPPKY
jgi:hypothetical protein